MKPKIEIVINPITSKPTICLQNWDTVEKVDGYTKDEVENLIEQLNVGVRNMEQEWDKQHTTSLFGEEDDN